MAKKIGAIVSLSIIGILILATIIMANVHVDYSVKCAKPTTVYVSYGAKQERDAQGDSNKIVSYISNASKEKALTALFNGTLGKKAKIETASSVGKTISTNSTAFYIRYRYEDAQKLTDANGKAVYYDDLVFEVKDVDGIDIFRVYVIQNSQNSKTYTHYYEVEADFESLYDYLVENNYNA